MIPDLRIKGRAVSMQEIEQAPSLDRRAYLVTELGPAIGRSPVETRDKMIEHLIASGDTYQRARAIADATATKHDRRKR